jgi:hypothetical protein
MIIIRKGVALVLVTCLLAIPIASLLSDWRIAGGSLRTVGYAIFLLGALVGILNFYLAVRPALRQLVGRPTDGRHVSGIPLFGMLTVLGLALAPASTWLSVTCLLSIVADTGNLLWFVIAVWKDQTFWTDRAKDAG